MKNKTIYTCYGCPYYYRDKNTTTFSDRHNYKYKHCGQEHFKCPYYLGTGEPLGLKKVGRKICILGSLSQLDLINRTARSQEALGNTVIFKPEKMDGDIYFGTIVSICFKAISEADEVIVIKKEDGSIGEGTIYEVEFAQYVGTPVVFYDVICEEEIK